MDTDTIFVMLIIVLVFVYLIDKNVKMVKYKKLYDQAFKKRNKSRVLAFGRQYHRYHTSASARDTTATEVIIANGMKAAGID